jgi:hypothetical protein
MVRMRRLYTLSVTTTHLRSRRNVLAQHLFLWGPRTALSVTSAAQITRHDRGMGTAVSPLAHLNEMRLYGSKHPSPLDMWSECQAILVRV